MSSGSRHPAAWMPLLGALTTDEVQQISPGPSDRGAPPGGQPRAARAPPAARHGHDHQRGRLPPRGATTRVERNVDVYVAPSLPYGVTRYAEGFSGAIGVPTEVLTAFLRAIVERLVKDGWSHVCLVNNHLEPAHDEAVRAAIDGLPAGRASVACPLTRRFARTLSEEFKRGDCHAGRYETSLALAAGARVHDADRTLAKVDVSLSDAIKAGKTTFRAMGLDRAYTGAPAEATSVEGEDLFEKLGDMIVACVTEGLGTLAGAAIPKD